MSEDRKDGDNPEKEHMQLKVRSPVSILSTAPSCIPLHRSTVSGVDTILQMDERMGIQG